MRNKVRTFEIVTVALVVLLCIAGWFYFNRSDGTDRIAKIIYDGQTLHQINLSKHSGVDVYTIDSSKPVRIEVRDDTIGFIDSQCPDHLCEKTGFISRPTQTAVCLPLKTAVVIESVEDKEVDMIAN